MVESIDIASQEQAKLLFQELKNSGYEHGQKFECVDGKTWVLCMRQRESDKFTVVNLRNYVAPQGKRVEVDDMGKEVRSIASLQDFEQFTKQDIHSAVTEKLPVSLFLQRIKNPDNFDFVLDIVEEFQKLKAANVNPREVGFQIDEQDHRSNSELWDSLVDYLRELDASNEEGESFHKKMDVFSNRDGLRDVVYKVLKREKPKN